MNPRYLEEAQLNITILPIFGTNDTSLPLHFVATNVPHVYGLLRPSEIDAFRMPPRLEPMPALFTLSQDR
jgi:hypothetical protein